MEFLENQLTPLERLVQNKDRSRCMARKIRKLRQKYPPIHRRQHPQSTKQQINQPPPNIVGIEDFPDVSQMTPQADMEPVPKHLTARIKPDTEPEPEKLGSPSTFEPIRPKKERTKAKNRGPNKER